MSSFTAQAECELNEAKKILQKMNVYSKGINVHSSEYKYVDFEDACKKLRLLAQDVKGRGESRKEKEQKCIVFGLMTFCKTLQN